MLSPQINVIPKWKGTLFFFSLRASQSSSLKVVVVVVVVVLVVVVVVVTFCKNLKICLPYSSIIEGAIKCTVTVSKELVCTIIMHKYCTCK